MCPVCLRRWRVLEAGLQGWPPMSHDAAGRVMSDMARAFVSRRRDDRYRSFYAHLARCMACEDDLAYLSFDAAIDGGQTERGGELLPDPVRLVVDRAWTAELLAAVPDRVDQACLLLRLRGYREREIADRLGLSYAKRQVQKRLRRVERRLRDYSTVRTSRPAAATRRRASRSVRRSTCSG